MTASPHFIETPMHNYAGLPYIQGGEAVGSVLSMMMALMFIFANPFFVTTRMKRLFFITSYHAVFTYTTTNTSMFHFLAQHVSVSGLYAPIDDFTVHYFNVGFILANTWILVGVLYSFITNKDGD